MPRHAADAPARDASAAWTPPCDAALADLLWREWGLCGQLLPLPSYADHNRRLLCGEGEYVLKIAHPQWRRDELDFENQALLHLARGGCNARTPRLHASLRGAAMVPLALDDKRVVHARLVDYVPGRLLADVAMSADLARSIGEQVARLTLGLSDFTHPSAQRPMDWNLITLPALRDEIAHIGDAGLQARVAATVDAFAAQLPQWRQCLPQQVVHNDANDCNLIVDAQRDDEVRAIIDFGDMCHSFRLCDLAVACVYAMQDQPDPEALVGSLRSGYESVLPLAAAERDALPDFIRARLCLSILMATRAHRADPHNDYVLISQRAVRDLLHRLG